MSDSSDMLNHTAMRLIDAFDEAIHALGYAAIIQYELEGIHTSANNSNPDFECMNAALEADGILGEIKQEYWHNQWEWASHMAGQTPRKATDDLAHMLHHGDTYFTEHDIRIAPISWGHEVAHRPHDDKDVYACEVHVPNAVQVNISVCDDAGHSIMLQDKFGERLQQTLIRTSYENCALFLPEDEAFTRLRLRSDYHLEGIISSPYDISGGHQGSIAFYQTHDKHNNPIENWQKHARIEHRLGAASTLYNPYVNCVFMLANIYEALLDAKAQTPMSDYVARELPASLLGNDQEVGALSLFEQDAWLESLCNAITSDNAGDYGAKLKRYFLHQHDKNHYKTMVDVAPKRSFNSFS